MEIKELIKLVHWEKQRVKTQKDERQRIYIPPEKRQEIIYEVRLFWHHIKMEYQKITNLLNTSSDNVPRFINKK